MKLRITLEGHTYDVDVEVLDSVNPAAPAPALPTLSTPVSAPAAKPAAAPTPTPVATASGDKVCKAPIPGNITQVKVAAGQSVNVGDVLIVLEAMKMETPLTSRFTGKIKNVHVQVGSSVKQGQVLIEFD